MLTSVAQQEVSKPTPVVDESPKVVNTPVVQETNGGCEIYRTIVEGYDWDANTMLAIMRAESGCRSDAMGDNYPIGGIHAPSCGLFQIRTLAGRPDCESLKNPATNIEWAYRIYKGQGLRAWSVFTNGNYQQYL